MNIKHLAALFGTAFLAAVPAVGQAQSAPYKHVLLISIDGMHAVDYQNCVLDHTCKHLAELGEHGVNFTRTSTSRPSDSFPGITAIVTGASPRTAGGFYDVAYDRSLAPPATTTGNGVAGGTCTPGVPNGTTTEYEEGIDQNQAYVNGVGPSVGLVEGGIASIDPNKLPRDPFNNCKPVWPWQFIRVNSIFGVLHDAGAYVAWSDKHPAYSSVAGHGATPKTLDDYFSPEINSNVVGLPGVKTVTGIDCSTVQDPSADLTAWTNSFQNIQCYDAIKVNAVLNWIKGRTHSGAAAAPVPAVFGMNFQALSVGQKFIDKTKSPVLVGGYLDAQATPSPVLAGEIAFVDASIGAFVKELEHQGLAESTLIIVTAKHGQSPIDPARYVPQANAGSTPATVLANAGCIPLSESPNNPTGIGPTEDDISQIWLDQTVPGCDTKSAVALLQAAELVPNATGNGGQLAIDQIFYGDSLTTMFNAPGYAPNGDTRTPDIIVQPHIGHTYTGSTKKQEEHGGFAFDDTNVMVLVSNPSIQPKTEHAWVETMQVAPTILKALGHDPSELDGVRLEGTAVLPDLF